jgi:hypothetical protein
MPKSNLNKQAKRKRELARQDKRAAKDEKRAQRKADARATQGGGEAGAKTPVVPTPTAGAPNASAAAAFVRRLNIQRPS